MLICSVSVNELATILPTLIFSLFIIANSNMDFQLQVIPTEKARLQRDYDKIYKKSKQHFKQLAGVYKFSENVTISVLAIVNHTLFSEV